MATEKPFTRIVPVLSFVAYPAIPGIENAYEPFAREGNVMVADVEVLMLPLMLTDQFVPGGNPISWKVAA